MKKDKKKITSVALASVLAVSMMPISNVAGSLNYGNAVYAIDPIATGDSESSATGTEIPTKPTRPEQQLEAAKAEANKAAGKASSAAGKASSAAKEATAAAKEATAAAETTSDKTLKDKATAAAEAANNAAEAANNAATAATEAATAATAAATAATAAEAANKAAEAANNAAEAANNAAEAANNAATAANKAVADINESKLQSYTVTFRGDRYTNIKSKSITLKETTVGNGVELADFINEAGITFDSGYELNGYYDSRDNRIYKTTDIKSDTTVYVKSEISLKEVTSDVKNASMVGRYVKGDISGYDGATLYVYYKNDKIGSGTVSNGKFDINVGSYSTSEMKDFKYYVSKDDYNLRNLSRVYPTGVELFDKQDKKYTKVKGTLKDYANTKVYVFLDGKEIGNGNTDKDGYFNFTLDTKVSENTRERDLKFYIKSDSLTSSHAVITRAIAGEKYVEGKDAGSKSSVTIKDSKGNVLGSSTSDTDGKFKINLNRALVGQETLTLINKESGKAAYEFKFIVAGYSDTTPEGYIKGFPNGTFKPNGNMTRAEAVVMVARLVNGSDDFSSNSSVTKFYDANNQWYSKALNYAVSKGIIDGYQDGSFKPNKNVTRAEFTKMISKYINVSGNQNVSFNDIASVPWAEASIKKAAAAGIVNGYPGGAFMPAKNITRAESVKMLNLTFKRTASSYKNTFTDVHPSDWFYKDVMIAAN